jgi:uncharacterized protein
MNYKWIPPFKLGDFDFLGTFVVGVANGFQLLLSNQGTTIILNDYLIGNLLEEKPSVDLQIKLLQRYFASTSHKSPIPMSLPLKPRYFIIDMTNGCNFDCCYCFRDTHHQKTISDDLLIRICNYIGMFCNAENITRIGVQLWGGEPLLKFEKIKLLCQNFGKLPIKVSIDLETNASLVTDEIASELFNLGIHVGVSIDGTPELHNHQRRYTNGKESSFDVALGVKTLQKYYKAALGGITVVTKHNVAFASEILHYYIFDLSLSGIKFNVVRDNRYAKETLLAPSLEQVAVFFKEVFNSIINYYRVGIRFIEAGIKTRLENLLYSSRRDCCISQGCTGGHAIVSIDTNGNIFPCEMTDFYEEQIASINDEPASLLQSVSHKSIDSGYYKKKFKDECKRCPWHFFCKGGCSSRIQYQKMDNVDEYECVINKTIYPLLSELILREPDVAYSLVKER